MIVALAARAEQIKLRTIIAIVCIVIIETRTEVMVVIIGINKIKEDIIYIKMLS